jgi:hypothetical protein
MSDVDTLRRLVALALDPAAQASGNEAANAAMAACELLRDGDLLARAEHFGEVARALDRVEHQIVEAEIALAISRDTRCIALDASTSSRLRDEYRTWGSHGFRVRHPVSLADGIEWFGPIRACVNVPAVPRPIGPNATVVDMSGEPAR